MNLELFSPTSLSQIISKSHELPILLAQIILTQHFPMVHMAHMDTLLESNDIASENGHKNSEFTHKKQWIFP